MYSPKINRELVPRIYREAKRLGVHMTTWVNRALEKALLENEKEEGHQTNDGSKEGRNRHESRRA